MKVIVVGNRTGPASTDVWEALLKCRFKKDMIITSGSRGVDEFAQHWAKENDVPLKVILCEGKDSGVLSGPDPGLLWEECNQKMVDQADALVAVWDGQSIGTKDIIHRAVDKGLHIYIHYWNRK
jgi:hypothetical protein